LFKKTGADSKKKQTFYAESCPEKQLEFMEQLIEIPEENRVYMDEAGVDEKDCERAYGYAIKGERVYGQVSGKRHKRQSIIAALCNQQVIAPKVYEGYMNSQLFLEWVKEDLCPVLKKGQVIILDNATFHKNKKLHKLLKKKKCFALFLPPYSPELNKIERLWSWIKMELKKISDNVDTLSEKILSSIQKINLRYNHYLDKKSH
jgi:transposase